MIDAGIFGVKAVPGYDNTTALQAAVDFSGDIIFPNGVIECSQQIVVTKYPVNWKGNTTIKATGGQVSVIRFEQTAPTYEALYSSIDGISLESDGVTLNQHGFEIAKPLGCLTLTRSRFDSFPGVALAFDASVLSSGTMQSVAVRDTTVNNCGGAIGYSVLPVANDKMLAISALTLDNFNVEGTLNATSPQGQIFDLRGMRHIKINNLICEGAGCVGGPDTVFKFASNGYINISGWHHEFVSNAPTYIADYEADTTDLWYGGKGADIQIDDLFLSSMGKIRVEDGADPHFTVNNWIGYNETSTDDLIEYTATVANKGPSFDFHNLSVKKPFCVPLNQRGYVNIHSYRSSDVGGNIAVMPTKIASWRPSDGSLVQFESAYFSPEVVTNSVSFSTIEPDSDNPRILTERFDGIVGSPFYAVPMLKFGTKLEAGWIGSTITVVVRYKMVVNQADITQATSFLYPDGNRVGTETVINTANVYNEWTTAVMVFEPDNINPKPYSRAIHLGITNPVTINIAAVDIYLGSGYSEPLDLDGP